jgi:hypothetical protein
MGFAVLLARMALDGGVNLKRVAPIVVSDLAWVLLSAALVVLAPGVLTGPGRLVVAVIAAVVGLMGVLQWCGGRLSPGPSTTA